MYYPPTRKREYQCEPRALVVPTLCLFELTLFLDAGATRPRAPRAGANAPAPLRLSAEFVLHLLPIAALLRNSCCTASLVSLFERKGTMPRKTASPLFVQMVAQKSYCFYKRANARFYSRAPRGVCLRKCAFNCDIILLLTHKVSSGALCIFSLRRFE